MSFTLRGFVAESNAIEEILGASPVALQAHKDFLNAPVITVALLENFVNMISRGATLRDRIDDDVVVGNHIPIPGEPEVRLRLERLL